MNSFTAWAFREAYRKQKSENRLLQIVDIIDWGPIRGLLDEMYNNKSEKGGRPNYDVLMMFHRSSVKDFELHNLAVFHTSYALHRRDPISRRA